MTAATIVHRYTFGIVEAIEVLIDDVVPECEAMQIRVEGDLVVVDIVAPASAGRAQVAETPSIDGGDAEPIEEQPPAEVPAKRKGGPIAQKAGIICGEPGFWTFIKQRFGTAASSTDDAAAWLRTRCGISSRSDLDHDDRAAVIFHDISKSYALWLQGYD